MRKYCCLFVHVLIVALLMTLFLSVPHISMADMSGTDGGAAFKKGEAYLASGSYEKAVENFKTAAPLFAKEGKIALQTDALTQLAVSYRYLGLDEFALHTLEEALPLARKINNGNKTAAILNSLGLLIAQDITTFAPVSGKNVDIVTDKARSANVVAGKSVIIRKDPASLYLNEAHDLAKADNDPVLLASVLNSKGVLYASRSNFDEATLSFKESIAIAERFENKSMAAAASANYAAVAMKRNDYKQARTCVDAAFKLYQGLSNPAEKANGLIAVGQIYRQLAGLAPDKAELDRQQASAAFVEAATIAEASKDHRIRSYALGYLGKLKEEQKNLGEALHYTRRALFSAQQINAKELLSAWEWQIGRILLMQGASENAIAAYRQAVSNLQSVKQTMYSGCTSSSLSYKDNIEPVYKELTDLLLLKSSETKDRKEAERYLLEARQTIESLKIAEMHDYFKNSCFEERRTKFKSAETLSDNTAIVYIISFPERIELLVSLPDGIRRVTVPNPGNDISSDVKAFRKALTNLSDEYMVYSKRLYNNLILPLEPELQRHKIKTLVVIPDDVFRTIPFAALHDGTNFVINKYAFATSLGMQLTEPIPFNDRKVTLLAAGISESVHDYPALPSVAFEMSSIKSMFDSDMLLNRDFSIANIREKVEQKKYSILHLASHGEFSGDVNNSFIVAWDGPLTIDQFGRLIKTTRYKDEPLDLITLSACKTAVGDDRAVLGLAGVALKAGALSSLATLWEVDDKTTSELVVDFYRQYKTASLSKAQALQQAQIATMKQQKHPYYWSPFLLIGNWL